MSRIAKQPIKLPEKVEAKLVGQTLTIKGPRGSLTRDFPASLALTISPEQILIAPVRASQKGILAVWGSYAAHLKNMITGVTTGYQKKLIIEGVGYKATLAGNKITFNLGWSHPLDLPIPAGLKVAIEKNVQIMITGEDKELLGEFAATIRALKKPEPYKGKGIHYEGEVIRRKEGKKVVS